MRGICAFVLAAAVVVDELGVKEAPLDVRLVPPMTPPVEVIAASRVGARPISLSLVELGRPVPFDPNGIVPETAETASGLSSSDWLEACPGFRSAVFVWANEECVAADEVDKESCEAFVEGE